MEWERYRRVTKGESDGGLPSEDNAPKGGAKK